MEENVTNLPPLPPNNQSFWKEAVVEKIEITPTIKCDHEFMANKGGIECKKCHFGFPGSGLEIREGKLFHKGEPLPI